MWSCCLSQALCRNDTDAISEWVAYSKIEYGIRIFEFVDPAVALRLSRVMKLDSPVESQYCDVDVEPDAYTRIEPQLFIESVHAEFRKFVVVMSAGKPYVAQVEEESSVDNVPDREAQFCISFEFYISQL